MDMGGTHTPQTSPLWFMMPKSASTCPGNGTAQAATQCDSIREKQEYLAKKYRSNTKLLSKINAYYF